MLLAGIGLGIVYKREISQPCGGSFLGRWTSSHRSPPRIFQLEDGVVLGLTGEQEAELHNSLMVFTCELPLWVVCSPTQRKASRVLTLLQVIFSPGGSLLTKITVIWRHTNTATRFRVCCFYPLLFFFFCLFSWTGN